MATATINTATWIASDPIAHMDRLFDRYGETFAMDVVGPAFSESGKPTTLLGLKRVHFTSVPQLISDVTTDERLLAGEANKYLRSYLGATSLFAIDPPAQVSERRQVADLIAAMTSWDLNRRLAVELEHQLAEIPVGASFELVRFLHRASLRAALQVMFTADEWVARLQPAFEELITTLSPARLFLSFLQWGRLPGTPGYRFRTIRRWLRSELEGYIAMATEPSALTESLEVYRRSPAPDALGILIDRIITTVIGAHESSATASSWAMVELSRHPAAARALRRELRNGGAAGEEALRHVCLESLRLHPVVPIVLRYSPVNVSHNGANISAGDYIAISTHRSHRRPDVYHDPNVFSPTRFAGAAPAPNTYFPFGLGRRRCVGQHLGLAIMMQIVKILATHQGGLQFAQSKGHEARNITIAPKGGVKVVKRFHRGPLPEPLAKAEAL